MKEKKKHFSAIKGYIHRNLRPATAGSVSELRQVNTESHLIFTAETHNFPTGVAPFSGATTGTGGRIRDVQCVGRGGYCIAGTAGYCVGNLNIPGKFSKNLVAQMHFKSEIACRAHMGSEVLIYWLKEMLPLLENCLYNAYLNSTNHLFFSHATIVNIKKTHK